MIFKNPLILGLLPLFLLLVFAVRKFYPERSFVFPAEDAIKTLRGSFKLFFSRKLIFLRLAYMSLIIIALARPQTFGEATTRQEGIAIMIAVDCSSTMLAEDLQLGPLGLMQLTGATDQAKRLNRLDAVKQVGKSFVKSRPDDMIGVIAFAAQAYVACPLTFDKDWVLRSLDRVRIGMIKDGTAIGSGILSSLNSLKNIKAKTRIIILLSDGINNFGEVPPLVAAKAARSLGVKIYTIGIASKGQTPFPDKDEYGHKVYKMVRIDVDEDTLKKIADATGGEYYRATDLASLKESYRTIDKLEKVELELSASEERKDIFGVFLIWALALLVLDAVLSNTFLRRIP